MITIYHMENSRSERIIWLMEELGLPYEMERFKRESTMLAPTSLKSIHPFGKIPIIRDGDTVVGESGAIVEYIIHRHGGGRLSVPPASPDYPRYLQWMHFAEGSAMPQLILQLYLCAGFVPGIDQESPAILQVKARSHELLQYIDGELAHFPYFAGPEFSGADIMMGYVATGLETGYIQADMTRYPNIKAYVGRIGERPAYKKAMAIAAPAAA